MCEVRRLELPTTLTVSLSDETVTGSGPHVRVAALLCDPLIRTEKVDSQFRIFLAGVQVEVPVIEADNEALPVLGPTCNVVPG
jgi:hypothetical protein